MKRVLKYLLITVVVIGVLIGIAVALAVSLSERKAQRKIEVNSPLVAYASGPEALAQGKYLFDSRGCGECHGGNGAGRVMIDSPNGLFVKTPNITPAGVVAQYTERDWERAIRHGIKPDGRPIFIMPSEDYNRLTDADLAAVVAYTRSLPSVDGGGAVVRRPLIINALYAAGEIRDAAEKIDHTLPPAKPVEVGVSVAHGAYVANTCIGCHGPGLSGGKIPGTPPSWPAAANLTPGAGSVMPLYDSVDKFKAMMRTGKRPGGGEVSKVMPFESLKAFNDVDLEALYAYLKTVPGRAAGSR
ncbi:MAG: cytochrome c [Betaproteobacteria bacterium]